MQKAFGLIVFFASLTALAQTNPLIRTCNLTNGLFHVVNTEDDQYAYCTYGRGMLDSLSIMLAIYETETKLAVQAYESTESNRVQSCEDVEARMVRGQDTSGEFFDLCFFADSSSIELRTLRAGIEAVQNAALTKALRTRFR